MNKKRRFSEKFQYWFDNMMAKGTISMVAILFLVTFAVVVITGVFAVLLDGHQEVTVFQNIWLSFMNTLDAGNLSANEGNFAYMILMTLVTICGLCITSVLIGIINTGMESKMEDLRKGKSHVLESGHTIILGFHDGVYTIVNELIEANANQKDGVIVIMDEEMEKQEMEDAIHQRFPDTKTTRIICRHGNVASFGDLSICSPDTCRSVIINAGNDFITIKSILAVTNLIKKSGNSSAYITAVVKQEENLDAARIAGEGYAEILFFEDTIAKIVAHTLRQSGLSSVFTELFDYGGDEIYIEEIPEVVGKRMDELNLYFPVSTVMGIHKNGRSLLNPPADTLVEAGDALILLAEDDGVSQADPAAAPYKEEQLMPGEKQTPAPLQTLLILGYDCKLDNVLREEDEYIAKGSEIIIAVTNEYEEQVNNIKEMTFRNLATNIHICDIYNRHELETLLESEPEAVLVLSNQEIPAEEEDAKTLLLLLQLRHIAKEKGLHFSVTSEMQSIQNQELAQITEVKDFVVSSNITSLMVTQISQTRELRSIFDELLTSEGSELYMRPASDYVKLGEPVSYYTAGIAASLKTEVCIGFRKADENGSFEIITNPPKNTEYIFTEDDRFIVLAVD